MTTGAQRMLKGFTHEPPGGGTPEWYTPEWVFRALAISFDVDVCSPGREKTPWIPAARFLTKDDDGLATKWEGRAWMNPPYGNETTTWMEAFSAHRNGIALVFARTDTQWFHDQVQRCDAVLFLKRRIRFLDANGNQGGSPGCGSMLVASGAECVAALRQSRLGILFEIKAPS